MSDEKSIAVIEEDIVEEFSFLDIANDKNEYIIDIGKKLPQLEEKFKVEENRIYGCQSIVWLAADFKDGKVYFNADSNSVYTKGLISLLIRVLSGQSPDAIIDAKLEFIDRIGMKNFVGTQRSNGIKAMIQQMRNYAIAYKVKNSLSS